MKDRDPRLLTDPDSGAPALLRDALASARADTPKPADLASLAAMLPLASPPRGGVGGGGPAAPPSALSGALIGAALGVIVSGASFVWDAARAPAPFPAVEDRSTAASVKAPRAEIEDSRAQPNVEVLPERPALTLAAPPALAPAPAPAPPAVPRSAASPAPRVPLADPLPSAASEALAPPPLEVETEAHLLKRAQDALAASPDRALALTQEHVSRFPGGSLAQEREVVAIQALVRIGRADEARARAQRFLATYPDSAHRRRIEALLQP